MLDNKVPKVLVTIIDLEYRYFRFKHNIKLVVIMTHLSFASNFLDTFKVRVVNVNKDPMQTCKYTFNPEKSD